MSLSTYADLLRAVSNYLGGRTDLNSFIPDFVTVFEAAANRRLRVRRLETSTTLTPSSGVATLPTDFLIWRRVTWTGSSRRELEYVHPSWLQANYPSNSAGTPSVFTIEGNSIKLAPTSDTSLELDYYQRIPTLSSSVNWLYSFHPDCYLFGTLAEAGDFTTATNSTQKWILRRDAIFLEIETLDKRAQGVGGIKVLSPTP